MGRESQLGCASTLFSFEIINKIVPHTLTWLTRCTNGNPNELLLYFSEPAVVAEAWIYSAIELVNFYLPVSAYKRNSNS